MENNTYALLRHYIVLNKAANGNVIAHNYSSSPRHTNFAEGGPGDISFHHFAYGNLVESNIVERIHIGDASEVGGGNLIYQNCITSGPLTIDNSPDARQYLVENAMYGSDSRLTATNMPPVLPEAQNPRPYLLSGNSLFNENGWLLSADAALAFTLNNWYQNQYWNTAPRINTSFYNSGFHLLISDNLRQSQWKLATGLSYRYRSKSPIAMIFERKFSIIMDNVYYSGKNECAEAGYHRSEKSGFRPF